MQSLDKIDPQDIGYNDQEYTGWGKGDQYSDYISRIGSASHKNGLQKRSQKVSIKRSQSTRNNIKVKKMHPKLFETYLKRGSISNLKHNLNSQKPKSSHKKPIIGSLRRPQSTYNVNTGRQNPLFPSSEISPFKATQETRRIVSSKLPRDLGITPIIDSLTRKDKGQFEYKLKKTTTQDLEGYINSLFLTKTRKSSARKSSCNQSKIMGSLQSNTAKRRESRINLVGSETNCMLVHKDKRPLSGAKYNFRSFKFTKSKIKKVGFKGIRQSRYRRQRDYDRLKQQGEIVKPYIYTMMNNAEEALN